MKKLFLILVFSIFVSVNAFGQIAVTVTGATNTTPNLLPAYPSLALALTDLNNVNAMTGPVVLTLTAGGSETAPPTGFVIGSASLNPVLSATNTVTIVKSGGTVTINAGIGTATPTSAAPDGMIAIVGANYITIDGLTLTDGNVANPATMEFGIGLFKLSLSDGAQNNTIQNCTINMQRINNASGTAPMVEGSVGILVINSTNTAATTALVPDAAAGSNSNNKFYANAINSGNYGIALSGYAAPSPFDRGDTGNDIGGSSLATGNTILNFGGAPAATNPAAGVRANNQWSINISYNTVNNNDGAGVNHVTTLRGIYGQAGTSANVTMNNNTLTIHGGGTTSQVAALENVIGSTAAGNTVNINNNTVTGDYLTATSGVFYGLFNSATAANVNMNNNSVTNMSYSAAGLTGTGVNYMIYNSALATNVTARENLVNSITRTGTTGGTLIGIYFAAGTNQTAKKNTVTNLSHFGTGTGGIMYGIQTSTGTIVCDSNTVHSIVNNKTTGTGVLYGIYNIASPTNENFNYNTVYNISHLGTGITYGMYLNTVTGVRTVSYNNINNINSTGTTVAGLNMLSSSPTVFGNKIYNINSTNTASPVVSGMILGSVGTAGVANIYNNIIGDIRASGTGTLIAPVVRGINITSATATSQVNLSNNSVYLNAPVGGANFTSTALWVTTSATATTAALTMRGNVLINISTPGATGSTNAYQRSSTTLTNYTNTSDYNLFYAGTPGAQNLIFYDGTNSDQTLAAFKTRVSPREQNSVTESPTFLSTTASNSDFLRPDSTIATFLESGATTVGGITIDFRGIARYPNAGYPNNPSFPAFAPDIGAYEFGGIWNDVNGPTISYSTLISTSSTSNRSLTATITDPSGVATGANGPRLYYKKSTDVSYQFDASPVVLGDDYTFTINNAALGGVTAGDIIQYYVAAQDLIPNVRTNPTGGSGVNPPGTTPPGSPNTYNITSAPLSGTYTVGLTLFNRVTGKNISVQERTRTVTKEMPVIEDQPVQKNSVESVTASLNDEKVRTTTVTVEEKYSVLIENDREYNGSLYHELTNAERQQFGLSSDNMAVYATITAALADLNARGVGGHTTLSLVDATYPTETFPLMFNISNVAMPSSSATITLKPATGVSPTISGSLASAGLIKIMNNYVAIDGSNVVDGTSKDMTITNISATSPSVIHFASNGTTPITNGMIENCIIINGINSATAVVVSDNTLGTAGYFNDITVQNNSIQKAYIGAYNIAVVAPGNGSGLVYSGNDLTTSGANSIRFTGIYVQGVDGANISLNAFANFDGTSSEDDRGTWFATSTRNSVFERNFVDSLRYTGTGGYGCYGIAVSSGTTNCNNVIKNNSISGLMGDGWNFASIIGDNNHGIYVFSAGQTGVDVFYNSINLYGNTLNQTDALSTGICVATGSTAELKNNNIVNNLGLLAATGNGSTGIYLQTGASQLESSDYNNIYVNPSGSGIKVVGKAATTNYATIQDWRTFSSTDANSISWDPQYLSNDFLLPQSGAFNGTGIPISSVNNDILGNSRSTSVANGPTDIGAFEKSGGTTTSMVQTINADGTYNFGFGGTIVGSIIITGYTADAPFDITWIRYSGQTPPGAPGGSQYAIGYDSIWISNGSFSATSYELRVNVNKNSFYNISDTNNIILAKTNSNGAVWQDAPGTTNDYVPGYPMGYAYATGLTSFSLFAVTTTDAPLPVELASFTSNVNRNIVKLNWTTSEEQNNAGFDVERKPAGSETWSKIGNVAGSGNSSQPKNYSFTDNGLNTGSYNYRLKQIDFNGNFEYYNLSGEVIVGVPSDFKLSQNYPNPFNPTTKIDYDLPVDSKVNLRVYDMLGREVASIVNEQVTAGYYTVQLNATNFASGTYFFRLVAQGTNGKEFVMTKKMQLIK
ncbi:MAG TPA: T9SS type A sorting domain-containing protein [Ignavibacteria bacterium]|nr:T9SS type A sorting domain-containing protein [Ignavibacteria bacterium]